MTIWQAERTLEDVERRIDLDRAIAMLPERTMAVLASRFNLDGEGDGATLEAIGLIFNVQRERIRQIEAKALRLLKHPTCRLSDYKRPCYRTESLAWRVQEKDEQRRAAERAAHLKAYQKRQAEITRKAQFFEFSARAMSECPTLVLAANQRAKMRREAAEAAFMAGRAARQAAWDRLQQSLSIK